MSTGDFPLFVARSLDIVAPLIFNLIQVNINNYLLRIKSINVVQITTIIGYLFYTSYCDYTLSESRLVFADLYDRLFFIKYFLLIERALHTIHIYPL